MFNSSFSCFWVEPTGRCIVSSQRVFAPSEKILSNMGIWLASKIVNVVMVGIVYDL
jgi:hypothetical protein